MGSIRVLDKKVRELISAGEVVERPASVVKELVENSIDAGATIVTVELLKNGLKRIQVTDNGIGVIGEDIPVAFQRYATSKIYDETDLQSIGTLGFRGEALASIAAVSKVTFTSKSQLENHGNRIMIHGGEVIDFHEWGMPQGTSIQVDELFYNTPARMKFLKKDVAEGNAVEQLLWHLALCNPTISIKLIRDGKTALQTSGQGLLATIHELYPAEVANHLYEINYEAENGITVQGFTCEPRYARSSRSLQHLSVNGRYIKSRSIQSSIEEAYRTFLMHGKYPAYALNISLSLSDVDVNVHPAKTEVRFSNERAITSAAYHAIQSVILQESQKPYAEPVSASEKTANLVDSTPVKPSTITDKSEYVSLVNKALEQSLSKPHPAEAHFPKASLYDSAPFVPVSNANFKSTESNKPKSDYSYEAHFIEPTAIRVIGELFKTYILAELNDDFIIIDMHAAHERILFEKFRTQVDGIDSQILLEPIVVSLSSEETDALLSNQEILNHLGFAIDSFGSREVIVRETPTYLNAKGVVEAMTEIADQLANNKNDITFEAKEWLTHSVACRAAIKAGHHASREELISLTEQILNGVIPKFCPHGRPVYTTISKSEIEKMFGRIV